MQSNNEQEYGLTFKDLAAKFDISLKQAAKEFGMSVSMLKKKCRSLNVKQWPYRKLNIVLNKVPMDQVDSCLAEILAYIRESSQKCNAFTEFEFEECTMDNVKKLLKGEMVPKKAQQMVPRILRPFGTFEIQEAVPLPLHFHYVLANAWHQRQIIVQPCSSEYSLEQLNKPSLTDGVSMKKRKFESSFEKCTIIIPKVRRLV